MFFLNMQKFFFVACQYTFSTYCLSSIYRNRRIEYRYYDM
ncbi:hypothetical protein ROSEINA2194_04046 [Roseburia inulinivorans DSM 16841]|uniref:Uncharacterized protein n=1 Tax=Roseburia inulinivorans DSM 16841 TaxID=622312 RepID=C0FZ56_9FIRM|nr:hypothetical protein ROSEINA2194_04046 [Roseburia inulinivorans DSM 16841]